jgi:uncharacterized protein YgbK (DUF1537 family)
MSLTVIADDLTGACDTGALFAAGAAVPVTVWPRLPPGAPVRAIDTESRALPRAEAAARIGRAAASVPGARYFKKIDSTLRGAVGAETDGMLAATGAPTALLCPALPAMGRVVVERVLSVQGTPVTDTEIARDPTFPSAAAARPWFPDVIELLRPQTERPVAWIPLDDVRAGVDALAAQIGRLRGMLIVADAASDDDLLRLVDAALLAVPAPLLVGSAGLGRALALRLGLLGSPVPLPAAARWLIVAGSRHPATRRQAAAARDAGLTVLAAPDAEAVDRRAVAQRLAAEACARLEREAFDVVAVAGGETAVALHDALDAERIDLAGAPRPGLAFGYLRAPRHPRLALLTKAGGFGEADLFVSLARGPRGSDRAAVPQSAAPAP